MLNIFDFTLNMSSSGATDGAFMQLNFSTGKKTNFHKTLLKYVQKNPSYFHVKMVSGKRVVDLKTSPSLNFTTV